MAFGTVRFGQVWDKRSWQRMGLGLGRVWDEGTWVLILANCGTNAVGSRSFNFGRFVGLTQLAAWRFWPVMRRAYLASREFFSGPTCGTNTLAAWSLVWSGMDLMHCIK